MTESEEDGAPVGASPGAAAPSLPGAVWFVESIIHEASNVSTD